MLLSYNETAARHSGNNGLMSRLAKWTRFVVKRLQSFAIKERCYS